MLRKVVHPFLLDITAILRKYISITILHTHREVNSAVDYITTYIMVFMEHLGNYLWIDMREAQHNFRDILFLNFLESIHTYFV